jgi:hypothetical protein
LVSGQAVQRASREQYLLALRLLLGLPAQRALVEQRQQPEYPQLV